jgi:hypothetical protein
VHNSYASETDKVIAAASFLTGKAMEWFSLYIIDWFNGGDRKEPETINLMTSLTTFIQKLNQLYGLINEELEAINKIERVRQTGSAGDYLS